MDAKQELSKLYNSRFLSSATDIETFEEAIRNLMVIHDSSLISEMCKAFDDSTEDKEVMYGLVHAIESFEGEDYFVAIAKSVPYMIQNSKMWLKILHYGILNDDISRETYTKVLKSKVDKTILYQIINLLNDIKSEKPKLFTNSVNEILNSL